jgi:hypothetical protein
MALNECAGASAGGPTSCQMIRGGGATARKQTRSIAIPRSELRIAALEHRLPWQWGTLARSEWESHDGRFSYSPGWGALLTGSMLRKNKKTRREEIIGHRHILVVQPERFELLSASAAQNEHASAAGSARRIDIGQRVTND